MLSDFITPTHQSKMSCGSNHRTTLLVLLLLYTAAHTAQGDLVFGGPYLGQYYEIHSPASRTAPGTTEVGFVPCISSAGEDDFLYSTFNSQVGFLFSKFWLNGNDEVTEGEWYWQCPPPEGYQFYTGGTTPVGGAYTNWGTNEPGNLFDQDKMMYDIGGWAAYKDGGPFANGHCVVEFRDYDECSTGNHNCASGCTNTYGSFTCASTMTSSDWSYTWTDTWSYTWTTSEGELEEVGEGKGEGEGESGGVPAVVGKGGVVAAAVVTVCLLSACVAGAVWRVRSHTGVRTRKSSRSSEMGLVAQADYNSKNENEDDDDDDDGNSAPSVAHTAPQSSQWSGVPATTLAPASHSTFSMSDIATQRSDGTAPNAAALTTVGARKKGALSLSDVATHRSDNTPTDDVAGLTTIGRGAPKLNRAATEHHARNPYKTNKESVLPTHDGRVVYTEDPCRNTVYVSAEVVFEEEPFREGGGPASGRVKRGGTS